MTDGGPKIFGSHAEAAAVLQQVQHWPQAANSAATSDMRFYWLEQMQHRDAADVERELRSRCTTGTPNAKKNEKKIFALGVAEIRTAVRRSAAGGRLPAGGGGGGGGARGAPDAGRARRRAGGGRRD